MQELELPESGVNPLQLESESVLQLLVLLRGPRLLHALLLLVQVALDTLEPMKRIGLLPLI